MSYELLRASQLLIIFSQVYRLLLILEQDGLLGN